MVPSVTLLRASVLGTPIYPAFRPISLKPNYKNDKSLKCNKYIWEKNVCYVVLVLFNRDDLYNTFGPTKQLDIRGTVHLNANGPWDQEEKDLRSSQLGIQLRTQYNWRSEVKETDRRAISHLTDCNCWYSNPLCSFCDAPAITNQTYSDTLQILGTIKG